MPLSANLTDVAAFRDYVEDFHDQLITKAFYSPKTVGLSTTHEGVKGKKILTILDVLSELAVAWKADFVAKANAAAFIPRELEVVRYKIDLSFTPQDFEDTYLGMYRKKGQNPGEEMPFAGYVLDQLLSSHATSIDSSLWKAVKAGSITPGTTPMSQCFDGFLELIKDLITAGNAPVVTPGGAITQGNIVALVESMWDALNDAYKETQVGVFMSYQNYMKYNRGYREEFGKYVSDNKSGARVLDFGENAILYPMKGLSGSDRIIMTPVSNLHVGYDDFNDDTMFEFEKNKRQIDFWLDATIGCQFALKDEDILVTNDLV